MRRKTSLSSFEDNWDLIGSPERSDVQAIVGSISDDSDFRIGLNTLQLHKIRRGYGPISVQLYDEEPTPVKVYTALGANAPTSSKKIRISRGLAEKMELRPGEVLKLHRVLDEQGRIKYKCENQKYNNFGQDWGKIQHSVTGIVAAIDDDGYNVELYRIGLSAMQMENLGIESRSEPPSNQAAMVRIFRANERGLLDGQDYGELVVNFEEHKKFAQVYSAFGVRGIGGCGVRVSSILAEDLGLKLEDEVRLYKK